MTKVNRTFRIDQELSKALDKLFTRHGDNTYHIECAMAQYAPIKAIITDKPVVETKAMPVIELSDATKLSLDGEIFEQLWQAYGKKGNKKTSNAKYLKLPQANKKLLLSSIRAYVLSTPDKQYRKNLETYINQECWNDEVMTNENNNRPNQHGRPSAVDRVREANERARAQRAAAREAGGNMADVDGHLRQQPSESVRDSNAGSVGITFEGDYSKAN